MVTLTIDGRTVTVPEGTTILEAAQTLRITIPTLCYLKDINEIAACRICMVEVEGYARLVPSCDSAVAEGMVVYTSSPRVREARRVNLRLLLSQHETKCTKCTRSGNCKLQPYFADVLCAADVDAFVFDSFSNPTPEQIKERLFPFIEKVQAAHPGVPMIFQKTIYRESRNFNTSSDKGEGRRMEVVDSLMNIAVKKYPDVYFVTATCATAPNHETSVDGTHPSDYGYTLWAESIRKPIMKILKKYGIR